MKLNDLEITAIELANLCAAKNAAYGDSVSASVEMLRLLYPDGIRPDEMLDAILAARIFDKLSRLVQLRRSGRDLHGEDPRLDVGGYALHAIQKAKDSNTWPGNASDQAAEDSAKGTHASTPTNAKSSTDATSSANSVLPSSPHSAVSHASSSEPGSTSTADAHARHAPTLNAVVARRDALERLQSLNRNGFCANEKDRHQLRSEFYLLCRYGDIVLHFCDKECIFEFESLPPGFAELRNA